LNVELLKEWFIGWGIFAILLIMVLNIHLQTSFVDLWVMHLARVLIEILISKWMKFWQHWFFVNLGIMYLANALVEILISMKEILEALILGVHL
jgi:hypothetical protein